MVNIFRMASIALLTAVLALIGCGGGDEGNQTDPLVSTPATDISALSVGWTPQQANWIGKDTPATAPVLGAQDLAPLLRRSFKLNSTPKRVVVHIAAYGLYVAYLNGSRIGTQVLEPPPSKFESDVLYSTFDVTGMVRAGQNVMGVKLGRGFLGVGGTGNTGAKYRGEPRVLAEFDIEYADGSHEYIGTDTNWKIKDSATRDAMMYGEVHDASADFTDWYGEKLDDSSWPAAKVQVAPATNISPRLMEPTRVISTLEPATQRVLGTTRRLYDFGSITAGWARLQVEGIKGTTVTLTYGEQLNPDGTVYQATLIANPTRVHVDSYTLSGNGEEVWEPDFTRHGFRYVQVDFSAPLQSFTISARRVHSALESVGGFSSSSEILNRLHANQANTIAINFAGIPIDTPWRDRLPWTADAWLYMDSARHNYDINRLYSQWIKTVRTAQGADGTLTGIAPDYPSTGRMPVNDPAWGGTMIKVVSAHYQAYGDRKILVDNYDAMKRWVDLMATKIAATGNLYMGYSFGDWASPGSESTSSLSAPEDAKMYGVQPLLTANGDLYHEVKLLGQIASELGKSSDAASFATLADNIKAAFNSKFFDSANGVYQMPGSTAGYRQTSNLIPLAYGLVPESQIAKVYANLVADIRSRGNHLNTGAVGTKLILPVLSDHGDGDLAYALAIQTTYPSWGYWLTQGATSTWETWTNAKLSQSLSHPFMGTYQEWLYEHLAGIQPGLAGYASVKVKPVVPVGLDYASASLKTPQGTVTNSWKRNGNALMMDVTIPSGVAADIYVPTVGSGAVTVSAGSATVVGSDSRYVHFKANGNGSALRFSVK